MEDIPLLVFVGVLSTILAGAIVAVVTPLKSHLGRRYFEIKWAIIARYRKWKHRNAVLQVHMFDEDGNPIVAEPTPEARAANKRGIERRKQRLVSDGTIPREWIEDAAVYAGEPASESSDD